MMLVRSWCDDQAMMHPSEGDRAPCWLRKGRRRSCCMKYSPMCELSLLLSPFGSRGDGTTSSRRIPARSGRSAIPRTCDVSTPPCTDQGLTRSQASDPRTSHTALSPCGRFTEFQDPIGRHGSLQSGRPGSTLELDIGKRLPDCQADAGFRIHQFGEIA